MISQPEPVAAKVAKYLLDNKAVLLRPGKPFQWASGWMAPIYCDNRKVLGHPEARTYIKNQLAGAIRSHYPEAGQVAGVATGGIPFGMLAADDLELPFGYVRSQPKAHGRQQQLEGGLAAGQKVVVIEDLISTGRSSLQVVETLREAGCTVTGLVAVFSYGFEAARTAFEAANCPCTILCTYPALLKEAVARNYIGLDALETLQAWQSDPARWQANETSS